MNQWAGWKTYILYSFSTFVSAFSRDLFFHGQYFQMHHVSVPLEEDTIVWNQFIKSLNMGSGLKIFVVCFIQISNQKVAVSLIPDCVPSILAISKLMYNYFFYAECEKSVGNAEAFYCSNNESGCGYGCTCRFRCTDPFTNKSMDLPVEYQCTDVAQWNPESPICRPIVGMIHLVNSCA